MAISNQFLTIPPGHHLAKEMYDLWCVQTTLMNVFIPGSPLHRQYARDVEKLDEFSKALDMANAAILFLQGQFRAERGGDESCAVSLTIGANGFPVVDGRSPDGMPFIHENAPGKVRTN